MKVEIKNRYSGAVIFGGEYATMLACLLAAVASGADLRDANLRGADLCEKPEEQLWFTQTRILADGDLVGWKKCRSGVIVKLRIPEAAKRSHAFGRKCRAEYAEVVEVIGAEIGISQHDGKTTYRVGETVRPDSFDPDWRNECAPGVHFFITRVEAENY